MDNLNTRKLAALYRAFPPEEARRLEVHHTHRHGSWLNMAESGQGETLAREDAPGRAPAARRDTVDWRFTAAGARIKLKRLYPSIGNGWGTSLAGSTQ